MRAWKVQGHGEPESVLELVEGDKPVAGAGQLLVGVRAAALGLPDVLMCRGSYPLTPPLPFTPGQEVAGVVLDGGDGTDYPNGTRVMGVTRFTDGIGGFAEQTIVDVANAFAISDSMTDADAAAFRIGYPTAWIGLVRRGHVVDGHSVLVLGAAGGSGAAAVQVGHALGARVLAVAAGPEKCSYCARLGADVVIDRRAVDDVTQVVRDATGGAGVDVVFDPVGAEAGEAAQRCLARDGRFLLVGFAGGRWPSIDAARLVARNASAVGVYVGAYERVEHEADHSAMLRLVEAGRLRTNVTSTVGFDEMPAALQVLARGEVIGKTVAVL
jgi:NADPH2:quinone reductase